MSDPERDGVLVADNQQPKKTRSVTFRIDSSIVDELQREADAKEVSLNVLVNQILKRYADWDKYENKLKIMPVPKSILSSLMDRAVSIAKDNGIKDIEPYRTAIVKQAAEIAFDIMKDSVLFMKKSYNLWTVLAVLQDYMKVSGISADHMIRGNKHVFVIQHELGENWSLFTKELLEIIFERLAKVKIETSVTPNTTSAEVTL
ncbi:MAG: hypothetical protein QXU32_06810 [Nitrososphaerales archaeon]